KRRDDSHLARELAPWLRHAGPHPEGAVVRLHELPSDRNDRVVARGGLTICRQVFGAYTDAVHGARLCRRQRHGGTIPLPRVGLVVFLGGGRQKAYGMGSKRDQQQDAPQKALFPQSTRRQSRPLQSRRRRAPDSRVMHRRRLGTTAQKRATLTRSYVRLDPLKL